MSCKHVESTVVMALLDEGEVVAIHQCDTCGNLLPAKDVGEVPENLWDLPAADLAMFERFFSKLYLSLFDDVVPEVAGLSTVAQLLKAKGTSQNYGKRNSWSS